MRGVLSGIRVLDFSTLLPGPLATLFLAEAGAEVIKIERPGTGDEMRGYEPRWGNDSANFQLLNRGKKSIEIDLKTERERLDPLIATADIIMEQFRPGVMARLGLGYEDVAAIKPDIIYCSITGYGQSGSKNMRAGHDLNYEGDVGILSLSHGPAEAPVVPPLLAADIAGGTYPALVNILLALRQRDLSGTGAHLDISMADGLFPLLYWAQAEGQVTDNWPGNGDRLVTGGTPRYRLYPAADGRLIAVAAIEQRFWDLFCEAIGLDLALRNDAEDPTATTNRIAEIIRAQPSTYWSDVLDRADCCCSVVRTVREAREDPHFLERGLFSRQVENSAGERMVALPTPICDDFRPTGMQSARAPEQGSHSIEELLAGAAGSPTKSAGSA